MHKLNLVFVVLLVAIMAVPFGGALAQEETDCQAVLFLEGRVRSSVSTTGAAYGLVVNLTEADVTLQGGTTDAAEVVEIHTMMIEDDVMVMNPLPDGLTVPAGDASALAPGGFHVMMINLNGMLMAGEELAITLDFADNGTLDLALPIMDIESGMNMDMDMDDDSDMDMDDDDSDMDDEDSDMDMDDDDSDMDDGGDMDAMGPMEVPFEVLGECEGLTGVMINYDVESEFEGLDAIELTLMFEDGDPVSLTLPVHTAASTNAMSMDMDMDSDSDGS